MKIRSITYFINPGWPLNEATLKQAGSFIAVARPAYQAAGYEVQSARLATLPFPEIVPSLKMDEVISMATALETTTGGLGFEYVSLGPALPGFPESYTLIPQVLAATKNTFLSGVIASPESGVSLPAISACAEIIHHVASLKPNGFGNLYFAALANVPPGAPFFPAAYHAGNEPAFALALEAADLAVSAFTGAGSLEEARHNLIVVVEKHAGTLTSVAQTIERQSGVSFGGLDFTLAPFPDFASSLGTAIEKLGVPAVGLHGSLAAAAFLTDALDRANYPRSGFNGLMLPILEDATLSARVVEGTLTITDLLLYSAVCGTGLDTVPLPGDTRPEEIAPLLLDLAALAQRLEKPLTARLMPIPGKQAGELTSFDFPFFANSRVLDLRAQPLHGLLAGEHTFHLGRRDPSPSLHTGSK
ncbi:MAG: DUF711 family protein [Anaerolineales bacterium]|nr:DUF711 family protein [Anaerolineales bacterium]